VAYDVAGSLLDPIHHGEQTPSKFAISGFVAMAR
jgi:hypothetical protein